MSSEKLINHNLIPCKVLESHSLIPCKMLKPIFNNKLILKFKNSKNKLNLKLCCKMWINKKSLNLLLVLGNKQMIKKKIISRI